MKKVLLIAFALTFAIATDAQEVLKQQGGENNFEVQFAPLGANPVGISGIRWRKFNSATDATRANVFVGFQNSTDKFNTKNSDGDPVELKDSESSWDVTVAVGKEKHFAGTDRVSPYGGAEVLVGYGQERMKMEMLDGDDAVQDVTTTQGIFNVGANLLAGVDVYIASQVYMGVEFGFGLLFTSEGVEKTSSSVDGAEDVEVPGGSSFGIGPNAQGTIRLGYLFNKGGN